jgi:ring-1,2-phenylacetyl-CoA epoxidase subunit PaaC
MVDDMGEVSNMGIAPQERSVNEALCELLLQMADDDLVIGHRDSEWLGLAPEIEGDIAFSSISQDEVGHATFLYGLLQQQSGRDGDELAFARPGAEWRNALLLERPNGDWAHTIVRHFLYDQFETIRLEAVQTSSYEPLAEGARKIIREEYYHRVHFDLCFRRLFAAGGEAQRRMTAAWERILPDLYSLFDFGEFAPVWVEQRLLTISVDEMKRCFLHRINDALPKSIQPLTLGDLEMDRSGRTAHTEDLTKLLLTMTEVYSSDPIATW